MAEPLRQLVDPDSFRSGRWLNIVGEEGGMHLLQQRVAELVDEEPRSEHLLRTAAPEADEEQSEALPDKMQAPPAKKPRIAPVLELSPPGTPARIPDEDEPEKRDGYEESDLLADEVFDIESPQREEPFPEEEHIDGASFESDLGALDANQGEERSSPAEKEVPAPPSQAWQRPAPGARLSMELVLPQQEQAKFPEQEEPEPSLHESMHSPGQEEEWSFDGEALLLDYDYPEIVVSHHPRSRWAEAVVNPPVLQIVKLEESEKEVSWLPPREGNPDDASQIAASDSDRSEEECDSEDEYLAAKAQVTGSAAIETASTILSPIPESDEEAEESATVAPQEQWEQGLAPEPLYCFFSMDNNQRHWAMKDSIVGLFLCYTIKSAKFHARGGSLRYDVCPNCLKHAARLKL